MRTAHLTIVLASGLAAAALATEPIPSEVPFIGMPTFQGPRALAGHLYLKPQTGEAVFTPAAEYLAARERGLRALGDDITGDGRADYWVAVNTDPCPLGTPTEPLIELGQLDPTSPVWGGGRWFRGSSPVQGAVR